jgi:hypothetical protein
MAVPNLIHPVTVTVQPLDRAGTISNGRRRAPVKVIARSTSVSFEAQAVYNATKRTAVDSGGLMERVDGYLVARKADLDALSYTPGLGDRIVTVGGQTGLKLYVTETEATAYRDGDHTLWVIEFDDRRPARGGA